MNDKDCKIDKLLEKINPLISSLERQRFPLNKESETQAAIEHALKQMQVEYVREYKLDENSRIDFYIPKFKLGIEVKIKGSRADIQSQCVRYAMHNQIEAILLMTSRSVNISGLYFNTPVLVINMGKAWL